MTRRPAKKKKVKNPTKVATALERSLIAPESRGLAVGWRWDLLVLLILILGYLLRSIALDIKPVHFDEGINGHFIARMWREGYYHYDPNNFHGPLYFYVLLVAELLFGRDIVAYRFVTGLISLTGVWLIIKHRRFFGATAIWAGAVVALSAGFVFYARYAIHESLFFLFQVLFSYGWFTWREEKSRGAAAMMLTAFFGMFAVKETFFIFFGTWFIAVAMDRIWRSRFEKDVALDEPESADEGKEYWRARAGAADWISLSGLGVLAMIALYTGFFVNWGGVGDMFTSLQIWTKTGTGNSGHEKPFWYWLDLMWIYEWPALFSFFLSLPMFFLVRDKRLRPMILASFGLWLAYSIIPYKTPWLILNLVWPLAFVFGAILDRASLFQSHLYRWGIRLIAALSVVAAVKSTWRVNFFEYANGLEKYVYVQSTKQMKEVLDLITERVKEHPEDLNMSIASLVKDPWPLPWLLGAFPRLDYGKADATDIERDVIIADGVDRPALEARLKKKFWRVPFRIRDSYDAGFVYLDFEKFSGKVPAGSEVFEPSGEAP